MSSTLVINKKGVTLIELFLVIILSGIITTLLTSVTIFVATTVNFLFVKSASTIDNLIISEVIIDKINDFGPQDTYSPTTTSIDTTKSIYFSRLTYIGLDAGAPTRYKTRTYNGLQSWTVVDSAADMLELKFDFINETITITDYSYDTGVESGNDRLWSTFISRCERNPISVYTVSMGTLVLSDDIDDTIFEEMLNSTTPPVNIDTFATQDGGTKIVKIVTKFSDRQNADVDTYLSISFTVPSIGDSNYFPQLLPN